MGLKERNEMVKVMNLMQHQLNEKQLIELGTMLPAEIEIIDGKNEISYYNELANTPGDWGKLSKLADRLVSDCLLSMEQYEAVILPVGSPAFQTAIGFAICRAKQEGALDFDSPMVVWAHSIRESIDQPQPDGSVRKASVFKHSHFYYTTPWVETESF
jgi:hypothetical protein